MMWRSSSWRVPHGVTSDECRYEGESTHVHAVSFRTRSPPDVHLSDPPPLHILHYTHSLISANCLLSSTWCKWNQAPAAVGSGLLLRTSARYSVVASDVSFALLQEVHVSHGAHTNPQHWCTNAHMHWQVFPAAGRWAADQRTSWHEYLSFQTLCGVLQTFHLPWHGESPTAELCSSCQSPSRFERLLLNSLVSGENSGPAFWRGELPRFVNRVYGRRRSNMKQGGTLFLNHWFSKNPEIF